MSLLSFTADCIAADVHKGNLEHPFQIPCHHRDAFKRNCFEEKVLILREDSTSESYERKASTHPPLLDSGLIID